MPSATLPFPGQQSLGPCMPTTRGSGLGGGNPVVPQALDRPYWPAGAREGGSLRGLQELAAMVSWEKETRNLGWASPPLNKQRHDNGQPSSQPHTAPRMLVPLHVQAAESASRQRIHPASRRVIVPACCRSVHTQNTQRRGNDEYTCNVCVTSLFDVVFVAQ